MGKTIQSDTLKLLHDMISKFKQNQEEREVVFKEQCLDTISYLLSYMLLCCPIWSSYVACAWDLFDIFTIMI